MKSRIRIGQGVNSSNFTTEIVRFILNIVAQTENHSWDIFKEVLWISEYVPDTSEGDSKSYDCDSHYS